MPEITKRSTGPARTRLPDATPTPGCGCWPRPHVLAPMNSPYGIQRCDSCAPDGFGDFDAAALLAEAVGGVVRFYVDGEHPPGVCPECVADPDQPGRCDGRWDRMVAVTWGGTSDERLIASGTDPWVEVDGEPVSWAVS
jgi:hypothetical protein